jgi:hypothetical protein
MPSADTGYAGSATPTSIGTQSIGDRLAAGVAGIQQGAHDAMTQAYGAAQDFGSRVGQYYDRADAGIRSTIAQANQATSSVQADAQNFLRQASTAVPGVEATGTRLSSFIMGSGIMSKMLFLVVVVITFLVLVSVGTAIITSLTSYSKNPMLLNNLKSGTEPVMISQDPRTAHSIPLLRSKNEGPGIEFTYSTWIFVDDVPKPQSLPSPMQYAHVFHKGETNSFTSDGLSQPVNSPGLYIESNATAGGRQHVNLLVVMSTFDNPMETITIKDVPLNKWLNVVIVVKGQLLDVYVNGTIAGRHTLSGVPMQSYGPLGMSLNGGFSGQMSTTQYFAYALSPVQIANIASVHPSLTEKSGGLANPFPPYLSLRWYTGSDAI